MDKYFIRNSNTTLFHMREYEDDKVSFLLYDELDNINKFTKRNSDSVDSEGNSNYQPGSI